MASQVEDSVKITYKQKKQLEKDINILTTNEHTEILNIIRNSNQKYSENNGGVYINLKFIDNNTIKSIIEFVDFCKNNRKKEEEKNNKANKSTKKTEKKKNALGKNYTLNKEDITNQLKRLKEQKQENFSFQNFLDKLSVTNIKTFKKNEKIVYPQLKQTRKKFDTLGDRILKKCRDTYKVNESINDCNSDDNSLDLNDKSNSNIDKIINNSLLNKNDFDLDFQEDEGEDIKDKELESYYDEEDDEEDDDTEDSSNIIKNKLKKITQLENYDDYDDDM